MDRPVSAWSMVGAALAVGAILLLVHAADLQRESELGGEASLPDWLVGPAAAAGRLLHVEAALQPWRRMRDAWYDGGDLGTNWERPEGPAVAAAATDKGHVAPPADAEAEEGSQTEDARNGLTELVPPTTPSRRSERKAGAKSSAKGRASVSELPEEAGAQPELLVAGGGGSTQLVWSPDAAPVRRVLIIGASSIEGALGIELERALKRIPGTTVLRWGRHSTGLARLDYFDWLAKTRSLSRSFHPDLVISQLGGNDGQAITKPDGTVVAASHSSHWEQRYAGRMAEFAKLISDGGARLVYLGMPIPRDERLRGRMASVNRASKRAVEASGHIYFSSWALTADTRGRYLTSRSIGGRNRGLRAPDGFHLSTIGSLFMAGEVIAYLRTGFRFQDSVELDAKQAKSARPPTTGAGSGTEVIPAPDGSDGP